MFRRATPGSAWRPVRSRWRSLLIVVAIAFELSRQSMASIQQFGLRFWRTSTWDPIAGEFGALPFIWGTLYSSVLALVIATPDRARDRRLHLRALSGSAPAAARLPDRAARRDPVDRLRPVGHLRDGAGGAGARGRDAGLAASGAALQRTTARRRHAGRRAHSGDHGRSPSRRRSRGRCSSRCRWRSAKAPTRSARRASKRFARRCFSRGPASSARSCSASAARSARRWRSRW